MATVKFTVPNWSQAVIAAAAGLDPKKVVVRHEDDRHITFLQHMPRQGFLVNKTTGNIQMM